MAEITNLIEMLKIQHKEQIEEQARQHREQMAVLIEQVKTRVHCRALPRAQVHVISLDGCQCCCFNWIALTSPPRSSATSWQLATIMSQLAFLLSVMNAELLSLCMKGGLVKKGHNDLRDSDARVAEIAWGGVSTEPILVTENDCCGRPQLQADWMARRVWESNQVAFFNNCITDADVPGYACSNPSWEAISNRAATV